MLLSVAVVFTVCLVTIGVSSNGISADSEECTTSSVLPFYVLIGVGCLYAIGMVITFIMAFRSIKRSDNDNDGECSSVLKALAKDIWDRKNIYASPALHLLDTLTDFASATEFYLVAQQNRYCSYSANLIVYILC